MKITSATFETSASDLRSCPPPHYPEFAFIGRSNVGKSSLINLLTGISNLAKVSGVPGKTRLINFFRINLKWRIIDLPGYGYAKVAKGERHKFNVAVANYLEKRDCLQCVFVLIDSRLPPQKIDLEFMNWLSGTEIHFELVFTKIDKQGPMRTKENIEAVLVAMEEAGMARPEYHCTSVLDKKGRNEVLGRIGTLLEEARQ